MTATTIGILLVILCGIIEGIAQVFFKKSALVPMASGCGSARESCFSSFRH